ncbi:hypothetical protein B0O41_3067 [Propionibacteriaceae bacterium ES.041]|uniref:DUF2089 domain-containing protein n=1 Tax=Enemella evansiae TaxID=2016499 RepID=A0A255GCL8_9ACTN|nr:DUF2089 domain-containing protein [Enemella evansiae]PFG68234.1 hypothetical protein B0O41_3067 [Propionibacteriaceae bacterium ES.041]OYO01019.1 hypothetical protein CGZ96_04005 [Enemella evansiae]OYO08100.1 hypothetical protein CGZ98_16215 [Enemella evansiae]OYO10411.1 hypothetical protein BI335_17950 [Enemella evansiae]OYO13585.1 hypothetical protein CGZ94_11525 [Enemella evansiae]
MSTHSHGERTLDEPHRPPSDCPVCGDQLHVTRLGCTTCGSELAGVFTSCEFCALNPAEIETLRVFLASRGNLREVEKHLGVSYPTARLRLTQLLMKLGLSGEEGEGEQPTSAPTETTADTAGGVDRDTILAQVASGELSPAEAQRLLAG